MLLIQTKDQSHNIPDGAYMVDEKSKQRTLCLKLIYKFNIFVGKPKKMDFVIPATMNYALIFLSFYYYLQS